MSDGTFEFRANFREFLPVYHGVKKVEISDGTGGHTTGSLLVEYENGEIEEIGSVSLWALAVEHGYQGTADQWMQSLVQVISSEIAAEVSTTYCSSDSGTERPSGPWSETPTPLVAEYLWTKTTFTWVDGSTSSTYAVARMGQDGGVSEVNGQTGAVTLHGSNLNIDSDSSSKTIKQYIDDKDIGVAEVNNRTGRKITLYGTDISIASTDSKTIKEYIDSVPAGVKKVNELTGDVMLYGEDINISQNVNSNIKQYVDGKTGTDIHISSQDSTSVKDYIDSLESGVTEVNGKSGNVTLYGTDLNISNDINSTVKQYVDNKKGSELAISGNDNTSIKDYIDALDTGVTDVNGATGSVTLYSTDISISSTDSTTIKGYIDALDTGVTSVNGATGTVTLYSTGISVSSSDDTTIKDYIDGFQPEYATNAEIDALFTN